MGDEREDSTVFLLIACHSSRIRSALVKFVTIPYIIPRRSIGRIGS
jgi:hypothetical protein